MTSDVSFVPITNIEDAQIMRVIRNECKDYMTRDTSFITEEQQERWFEQLDKENMKMFLMHEKDDVIGFGYCRCDNNETYLTGGLRKECREKGYGRLLFLHLLETAKSCGTRITLEVLNTNVRARRLYDKIGFHVVETTDRITKMEYVDD